MAINKQKKRWALITLTSSLVASVLVITAASCYQQKDGNKQKTDSNLMNQETKVDVSLRSASITKKNNNYALLLGISNSNNKYVSAKLTETTNSTKTVVSPFALVSAGTVEVNFNSLDETKTYKLTTISISDDANGSNPKEIRLSDAIQSTLSIQKEQQAVQETPKTEVNKELKTKSENNNTELKEVVKDKEKTKLQEEKKEELAKQTKEERRVAEEQEKARQAENKKQEAKKRKEELLAKQKAEQEEKARQAEIKKQEAKKREEEELLAKQKAEQEEKARQEKIRSDQEHKQTNGIVQNDMTSNEEDLESKDGEKLNEETILENSSGPFVIKLPIDKKKIIYKQGNKWMLDLIIENANGLKVSAQIKSGISSLTTKSGTVSNNQVSLEITEKSFGGKVRPNRMYTLARVDITKKDGTIEEIRKFGDGVDDLKIQPVEK